MEIEVAEEAEVGGQWGFHVILLTTGRGYCVQYHGFNSLATLPYLNASASS